MKTALLAFPVAILLVLSGSRASRAPGHLAWADDPDPPAPVEPGNGEPGGAAPADPADPDEPEIPRPLDERTKAAITRGVLWLRDKATDGWWGALAGDDELTYAGTHDSYTEPYGATALALYTLLKCGVPADDPLVKKGFSKLRLKRLDGHCYELAMKLLAITATADPFERSKNGVKPSLAGDLRTWAQDLVTAMVKLRAPDGWRYWGAQDDRDRDCGGVQDISSTQLVTLGLFAAERCGLRVDPSVWVGVLRYAMQEQEDSGPEHPRAVYERPPKGKTTPSSEPPPAATDHARGFAYMHGARAAQYSRPSGARTACGLGCLMMARFSLMTRSPSVWARQDAPRVQQAVYDGLAWLDQHWSAKKNPEGESWDVYYDYCVERAMDLVGGWRIGKRFWYLEIAEHLLSTQSERGWWETDNGTRKDRTLDTCFALLFLRRATSGAIPYPTVTGGSEEPPADNRGR